MIQAHSNPPSCKTSCEEGLNVGFNAPPNKQAVVSVTRTLSFDQTKTTTMDNMVAALRKKYGQESWMGGPLPTTMTWFLNEQGRPVSLPPKVPPPNCAGNILSSGAGSTTESNAAAIPFVIFGFADTVNGKTGIQRLMVDPCRSHVYINATLNGGGDRGVQNITIHISDSDLDTRAAVATQTYLDNAAAAQQQQELNKEKQQAAPKL